MESLLSQEFIHMPEEDIRCQTEVSDQGVRPRSGQLSQFRSALLGVTTYDLQLRKVITPSSELRFGCSWTPWKSHLFKNSFICLRKISGVRPRCQIEFTNVRSAYSVQVSSDTPPPPTIVRCAGHSTEIPSRYL